MPSPTTKSANFCTVVPAAFSICSIVCLSFFTNGWFKSDTSFRYFCTLPSTIFTTISAGLPDSAAFCSAMLRSFAIRSAGTSSDDSETGFIAAMCIATSLPTCSSAPVYSTSTPMRVPCRYAARLFEVSKRSKRRIDRFSPILPTSARRTASTVEPSSGSADSAATSAGFCVAISSATVFANARKSSFLPTKSVSQFNSTSAPALPPMNDAITPSAVTRDAALLALLPSFTRSSSSARSKSPSASVSAFLHSIIGASVFARSSATMLAVIAAIIRSLSLSVTRRTVRYRRQRFVSGVRRLRRARRLHFAQPVKT